MSINYWVVGAMFGGSEDQLNEYFIKRGYWYCWEPGNHEESKSIKNQQERFKQIKSGDRIAVKKLLGRGSKEIAIRAIGIVTDVDRDEWRVYVNWLPLDQNDNKTFDKTTIERKVPHNGAGASIHGPFSYDDEWVKSVFCI